MELLVTVVIVGILAGVTSFSFSKALQKAKAKTAKKDLLMIKAAQAIYRAKHGYYYPHTPVHGGGPNGSTGFMDAALNANLGLNFQPDSGDVCTSLSHSCSNQDLSNDFDCTVICGWVGGGWGYRLTEADDMPFCLVQPGFDPCPE